AHGSVGTAAAPVRVEMINAPDQVAQAWGEAGDDLNLDLSARFRGYTDASAVLTPHVDTLTAGGDTQVRIGQTVIESGLKSAGSVLVTVQGRPSFPESGDYFNFYRPDVTTGTPPVPIHSLYPAAAFATGPATAVDATWTFALAEA